MLRGSLLFVSGRSKFPSAPPPSRTPTARGTLPGPFDARRARDDPRRTTPRPPSPAPSLLPRLPAPPLPRAPAAVGSDLARPSRLAVAPRPPAMVARDDQHLEAFLAECVQDSLNNYMIPNAVFLCERLYAAAPTEVRPTSARARPRTTPRRTNGSRDRWAPDDEL